MRNTFRLVESNFDKKAPALARETGAKPQDHDDRSNCIQPRFQLSELPLRADSKPTDQASWQRARKLTGKPHAFTTWDCEFDPRRVQLSVAQISHHAAS